MLMHRSLRVSKIRSSPGDTPASVHVVNVDMAATSTVRQEAPIKLLPPIKCDPWIPTWTLGAVSVALKKSAAILDWTRSHS